MFNKTSWAKPGDIKRKWYIIDAKDMPLGRLATVISVYLTGKYKSNYVPNLDMGDYVIVTNVDKIKLSGKKGLYKEYTRFSGYPSGLKRVNVGELLKQSPKKVLLHAVRGMLPKNALRSNQLYRLRMFIGDKHEHEAQNPEEIKL